MTIKEVALATLKNLIEAYSWRITFLSFYDLDPEFIKEIDRLRVAAIKAVMEEQGIDDFDEASSLSEYTPLGEKEEAALYKPSKHISNLFFSYGFIRSS